MIWGVVGILCGRVNWADLSYLIFHFLFLSTSSDGINWAKTALQSSAEYNCINYSPELKMFISVSQGGTISKSIDGGLNWSDITTSPNTDFPKSLELKD